MKIHQLLWVAAFALAGCAAPQRPQIDREKRVDCARKASFELGCPEDKLTFACLAEGGVSHGGWSGMTACTSWGVTGCEKKAVYVLTDLGWINNTGGSQSAQ